MKGSIAAKVFFSATGLFLLLLLAQWVIISTSFQSLYVDSILTSMERELQNAVAPYRRNRATQYFQPFDSYVEETGSPIFVFTDSYDIVDDGLMSRVRLITVNHPQWGAIYVPVHHLYNIYGPNAPYLSAYRNIALELVQVGSSSYYEPLSVSTTRYNFRNRSSIKLFSGIEGLRMTVPIYETVNIRREPELTGRRAEFIYDTLKPCLVARQNISAFLDDLESGSIPFDGYDYRFFHTTRSIDSETYYFVTANRIVVTGFEQEYINTFFFRIYLLLGGILLLAAALLAYQMSSPIRRIAAVADRMARLDFSTKIDYKSGNELGRLAETINTMSATLQNTMDKLTQANDTLLASAGHAQRNEDRMKHLLADLAHEIKTPLGLISGYLELIEKNVQPESNVQYFSVINDEVDSLATLVNEAIELTKLQSGYWRVNPGPHNISEIIEQCLSQFEGRLSERGFTVRRQLLDVVVYCDTLRIQQVMANFISNALKYADRHKLMEVITVQAGPDIIKVSVRNSGHIDAAEAEKIWARDYGTREGPGTRSVSQGIGLSIVRHILELHKSNWGVQQKAGMVEFYFTLERLPIQEGGTSAIEALS